MEYDVTVDRNYYIGGSDVPVIMGISTFKTRWDLLLEKAGLKENDFNGNKYTVYGQELEPKIRDYINSLMPENAQFEPNRVYDNDIRCHSDGFNGSCILEIKTTSHIFETVDEYKVYLVQLLLYMEKNNVDKGILAVYERPEDFNTDFDYLRLHIYEIEAKEYKDLTEQINFEIDRFRTDLSRLKENPLLTEQDFLPNEIVTISNKVSALENRMQEFNAIEKEYKAMKQELYEAMQKYDIKSWETYNGTKITRVDGAEPTTKKVWEFDKDTFAIDNPDMYKKYLKEVEKKSKSRAGYVKITLPKMWHFETYLKEVIKYDTGMWIL